jgi:hypothetical protein
MFALRARHLGHRALIVTLTALCFGPGLAAEARQSDPEGVVAFQRQADAYAFMHRRLERQLPPIEVNADPETFRHAVETMAGAIRAARPEAQQGDMFNAAVQRTLRDRIARALRANGLTPADVRAAEQHDGVAPGSLRLRVNGSFPWAASTAMFPSILAVLPALPPELQYRMVGRDLVLVDVHASLIVDILPQALADELTADN